MEQLKASYTLSGSAGEDIVIGAGASAMEGSQSDIDRRHQWSACWPFASSLCHYANGSPLYQGNHSGKCTVHTIKGGEVVFFIMKIETALRTI